MQVHAKIPGLGIELTLAGCSIYQDSSALISVEALRMKGTGRDGPI